MGRAGRGSLQTPQALPALPQRLPTPVLPCLEDSLAWRTSLALMSPPWGGHSCPSFLKQLTPSFSSLYSVSFKAPTQNTQVFFLASLFHGPQGKGLPVFFLHRQCLARADAQHHLLAEWPNGCRLLGAVTTAQLPMAPVLPGSFSWASPHDEPLWDRGAPFHPALFGGGGERDTMGQEN